MPSRKKMVFAVLLIVHILWVFHVLAPQNIFNPEPIYNVDYPFHYYNAVAAREIFHVSGRTWGYDPFLWAGYPCNVYSDVDNKWVELLLIFAPKAIFAVMFKLIVFASFLLPPVFMYLAAGNFGLLEEESLISFALSIFTWNAGRYTYLKLINGMFSYILSCFICVYFLSVLYKYLKGPNLKDYFAFAATAALMPLIHILSVVVVVIPSFVAYIASFRKKLLFHASVILAALLVVIVNFFWLYPFLRFGHYKVLLCTDQPSGIGRFFGDLFIGVEANLGIILLVFGAYGILLYARRRETLKAVIFISGFLWTFLLAYFGAYSNTTLETEPYRFHFMMQLFLIIPASSAMYKLIPPFYSRVRRNAFATALLAVFLVSLFYPVVHKQMRRAFLHTSLPGDYYALSDYISKNTGRDSRIIILPYRMIITNDERQDESFWFWMLPALTGREIIPELTDFHPLKHLSLFRRMYNGGLTNKSPRELLDYLDILNVGYIVYWGEDPESYLKYGFISRMDTVGRFNIFRVKRPHSFFLKGHGSVISGYNKLIVKGAGKGPVVLKYHWLETLRTDPPLKISEYPFKGDEIGYIKVENGNVPDFTIYNSYR